MTDDIPTLVERLDVEDTAKAAASKLTSISDDHPEQCVPIVDQLVDKLRHHQQSVRVDVSHVPFNISTEAPESLVNHANAMAAVLSDVGCKTRVNLACPLAEIAFVDPATGVDIAAPLFDAFPESHDHYRHSIAWATEAIAPIDPHLVRDQLDQDYPWFDDTYDPVLNHLARAVALVTRSLQVPRAISNSVRRIETVAALKPRVTPDSRDGQAFALALGAIGSRRATSALAHRLCVPENPSTPPEDGAVRAGFRDAIGDGLVPSASIERPEALLADKNVAVGDWIGFEAGELMPLGGGLFGQVQEVVTDAEDGDEVRLWNPLFQYRARVRPDIQQARYSDPWRTRDIPLRVAEPVRVDEVLTLVSLLTPGDTVSLGLDEHGRSTYQVQMRAIGTDQTVTAAEVDGLHELTFQPEMPPGKAIVDGGLAFDITDATLKNSPDINIASMPGAFEPFPLW